MLSCFPRPRVSHRHPLQMHNAFEILVQRMKVVDGIMASWQEILEGQGKFFCYRLMLYVQWHLPQPRRRNKVPRKQIPHFPVNLVLSNSTISFLPKSKACHKSVISQKSPQSLYLSPGSCVCDAVIRNLLLVF